MPPPPVQLRSFGKRNVSRLSAARPDVQIPIDQAAFFAAVREDLATSGAASPELEVPRSLKAAALAGLVTGCAMAGIDVSSDRTGLLMLVDRLPLPIDTARLLPAQILVALFGAARGAAITIIIVHGVLSRLKLTSYIAYAAGGAAATVVVALGLAALDLPTDHGLLVDLAAGTGAGLLYRAFAGARRAKPA